MTVSEDLDLSLVKAFVLHYEYELASYDWVWSTFIELCDKDPQRAYQCVLHLARIEDLAYAPAVMSAGNLKLLLEKSADKVMPLIEKDLETVEGLRYALAAAMSFSVYTGSTRFDEQLVAFDARYGLQSLVRHFYDNDVDALLKQGKGFEFCVEDFVLRFCPAASDPAQVLYEASSKQSDDRVRLRGKVSIDEISKLRRQIVECLQISRKSRRIVLGDRSFLELIFDCQNTGQIDIRVNFWI